MEKILTFGLLAIIVICGWTGYKKGMIMGIGSVLAIFVSLYAANLLSSSFSYEIIPALKPFVSGYMDKVVSETVYNKTGVTYDPSVQTGEEVSEADLLVQNPSIVNGVIIDSIRAIGVYEKTAEKIAKDVTDYQQESDTSVQDALVEVLCKIASFVIGYALSFIIILILLTVIGNIQNFSFRLPNMDTFNDIGGAVLGLVTGFLFCFFIGWVLRFSGILISEDTINNSAIASFFVKANIISSFLKL